MKWLLVANGCYLEAADDGAIALVIANRTSFHLAITVFEMPKMNSIDLFLRIRQVQLDVAGLLSPRAMTEPGRAGFGKFCAEFLICRHC